MAATRNIKRKSRTVIVGQHQLRVQFPVLDLAVSPFERISLRSVATVEFVIRFATVELLVCSTIVGIHLTVVLQQQAISSITLSTKYSSVQLSEQDATSPS